MGYLILLMSHCCPCAVARSPYCCVATLPAAALSGLHRPPRSRARAGTSALSNKNPELATNGSRVQRMRIRHRVPPGNSAGVSDCRYIRKEQTSGRTVHNVFHR